MKAIYFTSLICFAVTLPAFSQTIYQLQYQFNTATDKNVYNALFVLNEPGKGFARVQFTALPNTPDIVVEMKMEEQFVTNINGETDTSQLLYKCTQPRLVKGSYSGSLPLISFLFKINTAGNLPEPYQVSKTIQNQQPETTEFLVADLITSEELTSELVGKYFGSTEPFYVQLFKTASRALTPLERSTKMYVIIVANTGDSTIGTACQNSMNLMEETFTDIAEYLGLKIQVTKIYGSTYNKSNVQKELYSLKPASNDIVIFYYVGHGFRTAKDSRLSPYIDLRANPKESYLVQSLNAEDIMATLKSKKARFNLLLTDCCNADPTATTTIASADPRPRASAVDLNIEKCRALFLSPKRTSVMMAAAQKGELASCNPTLGAFCSFYFKASLENSLRPAQLGYPTWYQVLENAKLQTINKAKRTYCEKPKLCKQSPYYVIQ